MSQARSRLIIGEKRRCRKDVYTEGMEKIDRYVEQGLEENIPSFTSLKQHCRKLIGGGSAHVVSQTVQQHRKFAGDFAEQ